MKFFLTFLTFLTLLVSCSDDEGLSPDSDSTYFPLQKGVFQVYQVEEVRYTATEEPLTLNYQLKAIVTDSFPSGDGQYTHVIHRSTRSSELDPWQALDTWSVRKSNSEIVVSEGNTPYVKLRFPLRNGNAWNGNAFNNEGEDEYILKKTGDPVQFPDIGFEETVTVEQELNDDIIVLTDRRSEIYARNAGLVYKEVIRLEYCTADPCLGQQKIEQGIKMKMTIIQYGSE